MEISSPVQYCSGWQLTARQYGEVVLPDEASGQGPGTLDRKLSRCKKGMARVFAVQVQIIVNITSRRGDNGVDKWPIIFLGI